MATLTFAMTRDQLHRKLASINGGLPRRVRANCDDDSAAIWDMLWGEELVEVHQWPRCAELTAERVQSDRCWLLLDGSVDRWRGGERIGVHGQGAVVDEVGLLSQGRQERSEIRARELVKALHVPRDRLQAVFAREPALADNSSVGVGERIPPSVANEAVGAWGQGNSDEGRAALPVPYTASDACVRVFFLRGRRTS